MDVRSAVLRPFLGDERSNGNPISKECIILREKLSRQVSSSILY